MKILRIFLIGIAVVVALTGLSLLGYRLYLKMQRPAESPFNAIPENTALIIKLNKAGKLWEELNRTNLLWKELSRFPGISSIQNEIRQMDSACRKNKQFSKLIRQYNLLISISVSGRTSFGALYLTTLPGPHPESDLLDFIRDISTSKTNLIETPYASTKIYRLQPDGKNTPFFFAVLKGVFMGSYRSDLVKKAIDRLSLNTPTVASGSFRKVESTTGKNVDANIYVNYRFFSLILLQITKPEAIQDLIKVARFADWSGLDVMIKKDELYLSGFTVAPDSNVHFLSLFSNQSPQKIEITKTIPAAVSYFTFFGWQNPDQYIHRYMSQRIRNENFSGEFSKLPAIYEQSSIDLSSYFTPWIGNQACLSVIEAGVKNSQEISFASFRTRDTNLTRRCLRSLADTLGLRIDSLVYKGRVVYTLPFPSPLPALFGELFGKTEAKYCTFIQEYIVFGSQRKDMQFLIDEERSGNMLGNNKGFLDFANEIQDKASIFYYFNTRNSMGCIRNILKDDMNQSLEPFADSLKKFESLAFQFNSQEGLFYSSMYLRFNPNHDQEGPLLWQTALDTTILGRPKIIKTPEESLVVVSDISGNMYGISSAGKILWKNRIMGNLLGKVHTLRMHGSDSLFLLFNTETHLYLFRTDGKLAERFPMRFPLHATNGLTLVDHDNNRDYRILISLQDHRVYTFDLLGKSAAGWEPPNLKEEIIVPVEYMKINAKDYLIISGNQGRVMVADRTGKDKIKLSPRFQHSPNSGFFLNRTNRKGLFVTTSPDGKVIFIPEDGRTKETTLNLFTPSHYFYYEDITGNGLPEFIFFDRNTIYYYDHTFKLIYSYTFRRQMEQPPFLLRTPGGKVMLGFVEPDTRELFLFDNHGFREMETGIRGTTAFDIVDMENNGQSNLIVGAGKILKNYRLTKP